MTPLVFVACRKCDKVLHKFLTWRHTRKTATKPSRTRTRGKREKRRGERAPAFKIKSRQKMPSFFNKETPHRTQKNFIGMYIIQIRFLFPKLQRPNEKLKEMREKSEKKKKRARDVLVGIRRSEIRSQHLSVNSLDLQILPPPPSHLWRFRVGNEKNV